MLAVHFIFVRSAAMMKRVGALKLAATVWPISTLREMTMPSIGAVITVCSRFTSLVRSEACDWFSEACDDRSCASADFTFTSAVSRSCCVISLRPLSSRARSSFVLASARVTLRRSTSACARTRLARACSICVWIIVGSRRAMTWPFRTMELKSACSSWMMPETCEPTVTEVTASSVPVAPTLSTMSPRVTATVVTLGSGPGLV